MSAQLESLPDDLESGSMLKLMDDHPNSQCLAMDKLNETPPVFPSDPS